MFVHASPDVCLSCTQRQATKQNYGWESNQLQNLILIRVCKAIGVTHGYLGVTSPRYLDGDRGEVVKSSLAYPIVYRTYEMRTFSKSDDFSEIYRNMRWVHFRKWWLFRNRNNFVYINAMLRASVFWTFRTHDPLVFKPGPPSPWFVLFEYKAYETDHRVKQHWLKPIK